MADILQSLTSLWQTTGIYNITLPQAVMIGICLVILWLGIVKQFEPLLLIPIGFGGLLSNIPVAGIAALSITTVGADGVVTTAFGGFLGQVYELGIASGLFPLLIFMGVGAMTDFGPLIANPRTAFLGAAAQFGIFFTIFGALILAPLSGDFFAGIISWVNAHTSWALAAPDLTFTVKEAASIGIIGGADGPTAIFLTSKLAPDLLGAIAVAAYSYMALVPIIQPPIMKLLTTDKERRIEMKQLRHVSKREKILFPLVVLLLCIAFIPDATPLIGALMFGNLIRECGVTERLSKTAQNELINIVTILLGMAVGSKLAADKFLQFKTVAIVILGLIAFCVGTGAGVALAKFMNMFSKNKINPLIGSAGVSAVPMAARVSNKVGQEYNEHNFLLMHAMGPNVAGVIGSAVVAGILLAMLGK
jgi:oxaloacetate decarboxylase beta subunit